MEKKTYSCVSRTKHSFETALAELSKTTPLPKITVKALCEQAQLSRNAFYFHYADIDALEREITTRKDAAEAELVAACALMDMVPDLEGQVLYAYYVRRQDTGEIARRKKYTTGYVRKVKRSAEQLLEMISPERVDSTLPAWYLREKGGAT